MASNEVEGIITLPRTLQSHDPTKISSVFVRNHDLVATIVYHVLHVLIVVFELKIHAFRINLGNSSFKTFSKISLRNS